MGSYTHDLPNVDVYVSGLDGRGLMLDFEGTANELLVIIVRHVDHSIVAAKQVWATRKLIRG